MNGALQRGHQGCAARSRSGGRLMAVLVTFTARAGLLDHGLGVRGQVLRRVHAHRRSCGPAAAARDRAPVRGPAAGHGDRGRGRRGARLSSRRTSPPPRTPRPAPSAARPRRPQRHQLDPGAAQRRHRAPAPLVRRASIAASPSRVASTRSKAVGVPPRWMWPSTVARVSKPVRSSISRSSRWPMPPRRAWPNSSVSPATVSIVPSRGIGALRHDDDREVAPARVAPPDQAAHLVDVERPLGDQDHVRASGEPRVQRDPARMAAHHLDDHHPVVGLSAVVWSRSIASVAICTAVSKPKVMSVPPRSLSIVFGTPSTRQAVLVVQARRRAQRVLAADRDQPVEVERVEVLADALDARRLLERVRPRACAGSCRRAAGSRGRLDRQLVVGVLERPAPAVAEADDRVPVAVDPLAHDRPDHGVEPRAVASAGENPDAHGRDDTRARQNHPAWRPRAYSKPAGGFPQAPRASTPRSAPAARPAPLCLPARSPSPAAWAAPASPSPPASREIARPSC